MGIRGYNYGRKKILPFVSTWDTTKTSTGSSTATQIKLPLSSSGSYNFVVDWGDGNQNIITTYNQAEVTHTYATSGVYTLSITGTIKGWSFNNTGDKLKISSIQSWGVLQVGVGTSIVSHFYGCANLVLTGVSDILITTGYSTFAQMFMGCTSLTTINKISQWNISPITTLYSVFNGCINFNQDISAWNTSNVIDITGAFQGATNYSNAGVSLNNWNVSKVNIMSLTFNGTKYNSPLNLWNLSACTNTSNLFQDNIVFNQDISMWNVSNVNNMNNMFNGATAFDQNIGNWNVSKVSSGFINFMLGKTPSTFSAANLDAIYNGWSSRPVQSGLTITFGTAKYTSAGQAGRDILTSSGWTIQDGGI